MVNGKFRYARHRVPKVNDHEDICVRVAALLAEERQRKGLSMTQLATGAGLSQPSVSYLERNLRNPNLTTLLRLSDALGLNLGKLIERAVKDIRTGR